MSLLTVYRPNFCSECGVKIVRLHWYPWTSRRFCDSCVPRFRKEHWLQTALVGLTLLLLGSIIGRALRRDAAPLIIQRKVVAPTSSQTPAAGDTPPIAEDEVNMCGARTKKGTPCSRRVHGPVRCWQHKGVPAMLSQEKLRIKE